MAQSLALGPCLARGQGSQHRQTPDTAGERHLHQHHGAQPAQAATGRLRRVRAVARVIEAPSWADVGTTAALKRVVEADDDWSRRHKGGDDHVQQRARQREARPSIAVEHAMKGGKAGETRRVCARMLGEAQSTQTVGDGARSDCQQRAGGQGRRRGTGPAGKRGEKG